MNVTLKFSHKTLFEFNDLSHFGVYSFTSPIKCKIIQRSFFILSKVSFWCPHWADVFSIAIFSFKYVCQHKIIIAIVCSKYWFRLIRKQFFRLTKIAQIIRQIFFQLCWDVLSRSWFFFSFGYYHRKSFWFSFFAFLQLGMLLLR